MRCEECGFDPESVSPEAAPAALRRFGPRYRAPLTRLLAGEDGHDVLSRRPQPQVWSAVEYAAHVRDVFELFDRRIAQVLAEDDPELEVIDHDAVVAERRYRELDATAVAEELAAAAERLARTLESLGPGDWDRTGRREGEPRSVVEIARRAVHEGSHHLLDVGRVLRNVRGR
ncbi:MAG TPA: DinB family protein [Acidimicrobiales bacterium]|nr:DinB family protein [Acidimicrobiales bacterium]